MLLGRSRFQGNRQPLHNFPGLRSDHVTAQHFVSVGIHDQLHQRALLTLGEGQFHRPEAALEDLYLMPFFDGLLFAQAHCADIRQAEYRRRDHLVVHRTVLLRLEQATCNGHAFSQRNRRQLYPPNHVANRQNRRLGALIKVVDLNEAACVEFDRGVLQPQVIQHRTTPGGVEHAIGDQLAPILEGGFQAAIGLLVDTRNIGVELHVHPALEQLFVQVLAHRPVEAAQEHLTAIQQ